MPLPAIQAEPNQPKTHPQLIYFIVEEVFLFMLARILSVCAYYLALVQLTRDNLQVGAFYNPIILIANWVRLFVSNIVPKAADASLDSDPVIKRQKLEALYKTTFVSAFLPALVTVGICQAYTLSLRELKASEETYQELVALPAIFSGQLLLLELMATQSNYIIGLNPPKKDLAIFIAYAAGAVVMWGSVQGLIQWRKSIDMLLLGNAFQLFTVVLLLSIYSATKYCDGIMQSLFTRHGWGHTWAQSKEIYKKSWQPAMIYFARAASQISMIKVLSDGPLQAFQALSFLSSTMEGIAILFEGKMTRFVREILNRLGNNPIALGSELRWTMFYLSLIVSSFPILLIVLAASIPNFFNLFIDDIPKNQSLRIAGLDNGKAWAPFLMGFINIINSVARGAIYGTRDSSDKYHGRINLFSTIASLISAILFPVLTIAFQQGIEDEVGCAWLSLIASQALGAIAQMAMAIDFTRYETNNRLQQMSDDPETGLAAVGCWTLFSTAQTQYVRLRNMPSLRQTETSTPATSDTVPSI